ncbi:hypothetical protein [Hathewaya massiliensis]|uniref:hypothetical protein n=1 Tax=Hathewaya massiliensis TaxID=1964382 RepID=UPI00115B5ADF|nr:hypothetical protein [Hathewaya massiliensis]
MKILMFLLSTLLSAFIGFLIFSFLREFVFSKIKLNKWIILGINVAILIIPAILKIPMDGLLGRTIFPTIYIIFFLWFLDAAGLFAAAEGKGKAYGDKKRKENDIIKPKAKPNRVKNINKEKEDK